MTQEQLDLKTDQWRQEIKSFCGGLRSRLEQLRAQCSAHEENRPAAEEINQPLHRPAPVEPAVPRSEPVEMEETDRIQQLKRSLADRIAARQR